MRLRKKTVIRSAMLAAALFTATHSHANPAEDLGYELTWHDEFDGDALNTEAWAFRGDAKHRSVQLTENVQIADGVLTLRLSPLDEPIRGKHNTGAGIVTKERFHYGYYEVRAKLGDGRDDDNDGTTDEGWHHAFWAMFADVSEAEQGEPIVTTTYPPERRTEIDCYENAGPNYGKFTQHIIIWKPDGKEFGRRPKPHGDVVKPAGHDGKPFDPAAWNTYSFLWTAEGVQFYVNGEKTVYGEYPADQFTHDRLNVWLTAISANWCDKDPETSLAVYDYFRYYTPPSTGEAPEAAPEKPRQQR